jgi:membrane fusion protein (multidrug efflux system)
LFAAVFVLATLAGSPLLYHHITAAASESDPLPTGKAKLGFTDDAAPADNHTAMEIVAVEAFPRHTSLGLTGTLEADEHSSIASNVSGIVTEVLVDRGSAVRKGDVLVRLDPTDAQNRLAEGIALAAELKAKVTWDETSDSFNAEAQPAVKLADAALALAASRKRRAEALIGKNAITVDEFEQYNTEYDAASQRRLQAMQDSRHDYFAYQTAVAKLTALRKAVTDTAITAPYDGLVVARNVAVGEQVTGGAAGSKVVTMVRSHPLRVSLTVPQQSIGLISPEQNVHFRVDSFPERTFLAVTRFISPEVTGDTRSLVVEAVADNADGLLRPGMFVTAELELSPEQPEVRIPITAVKRAGEVAKVLVVDNEIAREQVIALGEESGGMVTVRSGLTGQERLVNRPELFQDGVAVH